MFFTQIMTNDEVNMYNMEVSTGVSQLKGVTFVKMGIVDKFLKYAQKHVKKKVRKEP